MANFWFKFEWDAWRNDRQLRRCSKETRGFWIDCIAVMEEQQTFFIEGTPEEICREVVADRGEFDRSIAELARHGAATIEACKCLTRCLTDVVKPCNALNKEKCQGAVKVISRRLLKKISLTEYNKLKQQAHRNPAPSSNSQEIPSLKDIEIKNLRTLDSPIGEVSSKAEPKIFLPSDFRPTEEMLLWCSAECPHVDPLYELQEFIEFWRDIATKNHKRTSRGWNATWKNRMRDLEKRHGTNKQPAQKPSAPETVGGYDFYGKYPTADELARSREDGGDGKRVN